MDKGRQNDRIGIRELFYIILLDTASYARHLRVIQILSEGSHRCIPETYIRILYCS